MADGARRKVRRDWEAVLAAQAASGQTAGTYCRGHDIPYKTFLYHRRKAVASAGQSRPCALLPASVPAFIPMRVSVTAAPRAVLRLPPGIEVECERLPEAGWLAELAHRLSGGMPRC